VDALAVRGITRLVVAPVSADPAEQRAQLSAFAGRLSLAGAGGLLAPADYHDCCRGWLLLVLGGYG